MALEADAISYADHIGFYIDHLARGVYPLWDPTWYGGVPNDFFLRRIGDVNPLLFLLVVLKWVGLSSAKSYLVFLGVYYFLGAWGFYLIAQRVLENRICAYGAYILFIFSSWGCEIFYNYIIIIFVPIIWFFYFLLTFARQLRKSHFLGMSFCLGLIVTTYIPFFFLTILTIFAFLFLLFYWKSFQEFFLNLFVFIQKNLLFAILCVVFLVVSCVPALLFYKESKNGEFVLPNRHSGADTSSALGVGLDNVMSGDIISHGYFDRVFDDHAHLDLGDIYIPYIFFLILIVTIAARVDRLIYFLLFNILALALITITSAAGVHRFLFEHVIIFKFIRNIYYFFWLAMLPMAILLAMASFKSLLSTIDGSLRKTSWLIYIIACHLLFGLFLLTHQGVLWGAWAAIVISLSYFICYFYIKGKFFNLVGFLLLLLAVFVQSLQVYQLQAKEIYKIQHVVAVPQEASMSSKKVKMSLYYVAHWFAVLVDYIEPDVLSDYMSHKFIFYDNVIPYNDNPEFFKTFQPIIVSKANIAFLPKAESDPADWRSNSNSDHVPTFDPILSGPCPSWTRSVWLSNAKCSIRLVRFQEDFIG